MRLVARVRLFNIQVISRPPLCPRIVAPGYFTTGIDYCDNLISDTTYIVQQSISARTAFGRRSTSDEFKLTPQKKGCIISLINHIIGLAASGSEVICNAHPSLSTSQFPRTEAPNLHEPYPGLLSRQNVGHRSWHLAAVACRTQPLFLSQLALRTTGRHPSSRHACAETAYPL